MMPWISVVCSAENWPAIAGTVAKPTVAKPTVAKPTVAKPTVAKPTVAKPTIGRPMAAATSAPSKLFMREFLCGPAAKYRGRLLRQGHGLFCL